MEPQSLYDHLHQKLAKSWQNQPDKPEETPESTLDALWRLAARQTPASQGNPQGAFLPPLEGEAADRLVSLVDRRLAGEPLAYLVGRQVFMGIEFLSSPKAMIPRKETELLGRVAVDLAHRLVQELGTIRVLDLCTGSGNLALAVARSEINCQVIGVDLSPEAVELAQENAHYLEMSERAYFYQGDLFEPFENRADSQLFHLIVCNPPYISSARVDLLPDEIRNHEPRMALDGGPFGIRILTRLIEQAPHFLYPGSWICFEVGAGQGNSIANMLRKRLAYCQVESFTNEDGEIRVLSAQTRSAGR